LAHSCTINTDPSGSEISEAMPDERAAGSGDDAESVDAQI